MAKKKGQDASAPLSPKRESILMVLYRYGQEGIYNLNLLDEIKAADKAVGRKPMSLGTFYPTVKRLEEDGLISGFWGEEISPGVRRRYLRITGSGITALTTDRQYRAILSGALPDDGNLPVPPWALFDAGGGYVQTF